VSPTRIRQFLDAKTQPDERALEGFRPGAKKPDEKKGPPRTIRKLRLSKDGAKDEKYEEIATY
jgi:hypothetical protein